MATEPTATAAEGRAAAWKHYQEKFSLQQLADVAAATASGAKKNPSSEAGLRRAMKENGWKVHKVEWIRPRGGGSYVGASVVAEPQPRGANLRVPEAIAGRILRVSMGYNPHDNAWHWVRTEYLSPAEELSHAGAKKNPSSHQRPDEERIARYLEVNEFKYSPRKGTYSQVGAPQFRLIKTQPGTAAQGAILLTNAYVQDIVTGAYKRIPFFLSIGGSLRHGSVFDVSGVEALALAGEGAEENPDTLPFPTREKIERHPYFCGSRALFVLLSVRHEWAGDGMARTVAYAQDRFEKNRHVKIPFWHRRRSGQRTLELYTGIIRDVSPLETLGSAEDNPVFRVGDLVMASVFNQKPALAEIIAFDTSRNRPRTVVEFLHERELPGPWAPARYSIPSKNVRPLTPMEALALADKNPAGRNWSLR